MNFSDGRSKGIKQILCERGLWRRNMVGETGTMIFTYRLLRTKNYISTTRFSGSKIGIGLKRSKNSGHVCIVFQNFTVY